MSPLRKSSVVSKMKHVLLPVLPNLCVLLQLFPTQLQAHRFGKMKATAPSLQGENSLPGTTTGAPTTRVPHSAPSTILPPPPGTTASSVALPGTILSPALEDATTAASGTAHQNFGGTRVGTSPHSPGTIGSVAENNPFATAASSGTVATANSNYRGWNVPGVNHPSPQEFLPPLNEDQTMSGGETGDGYAAGRAPVFTGGATTSGSENSRYLSSPTYEPTSRSQATPTSRWGTTPTSRSGPNSAASLAPSARTAVVAAPGSSASCRTVSSAASMAETSRTAGSSRRSQQVFPVSSSVRHGRGYNSNSTPLMEFPDNIGGKADYSSDLADDNPCPCCFSRKGGFVSGGFF
ncbi:unnamed protein product [Amoebophrya sp. A120]|nr:unnamed protein product [Amoebophrya sp. A120]|eukprot:GSA120T00000458001.1